MLNSDVITSGPKTTGLRWSADNFDTTMSIFIISTYQLSSKYQKNSSNASFS